MQNNDCKVIAIANHKGGVGKTTSVASIGIGLSRKGYRVLLLDLDAQANLTSFFLDTDEDRDSIYDSMVQGKPLPIEFINDQLHLAPSGLEMARIESDLTGRIAREHVLQSLLKPIQSNYDFVLIDCPPSLGIVTTNAFIASNNIYVPLTAEALPMKGMKMLEDYIDMIRIIKKELRISGIFITRYNNRNLNNVVDSQMREVYNDVVFETKIRENISLAEVPVFGGNIFDYAPGSNGAKDYASLIDEIVARNK